MIPLAVNIGGLECRWHQRSGGAILHVSRKRGVMHNYCVVESHLGYYVASYSVTYRRVGDSVVFRKWEGVFEARGEATAAIIDNGRVHSGGHDRKEEKG